MDNQHNQLSDVSLRVLQLEASPPAPARESNQAAEKRVLFKSPVDLFDGTFNSTTYVDSGSARYIPKDAKYALVYVAFEDTASGSGRSTLWAKSSVEMRLVSNYEGIISGASTHVQVPVVGGRFDWRVSFASGGSDATVLLSLEGYIL